MAVSAVLITVSGIVYKQSAIMMLPLYISLFVMLLNSSANRFGPLIGGLNCLLYTYVYFHYGLYGMAISTLLTSVPIQIMTFILWNKHAYQSSTVFKKLSLRGRVITAAIFAAVCVGAYALLSMTDSSYKLLDTLNSLFGILVSLLTLFAFIEYAPLNLVSSAIAVVTYVILTVDAPEQMPFLVSTVHSLICVVRANFCVFRLYSEQKVAKRISNDQ